MKAVGERLTATIIRGLWAGAVGLFALAGLTWAAGTVLLSLGGGGRVGLAPGGSLDIPVQVAVTGSGENVASLDLRFTWDPTKLVFVSATDGGFGVLTLNEADVANGVLRGNLFSATGATSDFDVLSFVVNAQNLADPTLTTINVEILAAGNELGVPLTTAIENLEVCIGIQGLLGDVTGDDVVDIIDAQQIARASVGLPVSATVGDRLVLHGDVTGDGSTGIIDAQQIARFVVGLDVVFPIGQSIGGGCAPGTGVGDPTLPPSIRIVGLSPGESRVSGLANNVDAGSARVVLYALTDIYYVQPLRNRPFTSIRGDGSWSNTTHPWTSIVALLVDPSYLPVNTSLQHPASASGVLAWDQFPEPVPDRRLQFSGLDWFVKRFEGDFRFDPGPNFFSDDATAVWTDAEGLHLKIEEREGKWFSAEVFAEESLGYGIYTFQLSSPVDALDPRAVFAGFVYETVGREVDIEFSRALANPSNAQAVVQPFTRPGNLTRWDMPAVERSSHRFEWRADRIDFVSWRGHETEPTADSMLFEWTYEGPDIPPPGGERMRFNLWLFGGAAPATGVGDEVIVRSFTHRP